VAEQPRALSEPWYRAVAVDRWVQGVLPADQWLAVAALVDDGQAEVEAARTQAGFLARRLRQSSLPLQLPRAWALEVVPLVRVLAEDAKAGTPLELRVDLRGPHLPDKVVAAGRLPDTGRGVRIDQTVYLDRWLALGARLNDGTRVSLEITDRVRHRKIRKSNGRKVKWKEKEKVARRIDVEVAGKVDAHDLVVPTPPPRLPVYSKPGASRPTVTARLDHPLPAPGGDGVRLVLKTLAEVHRHVRPRTGTPA